MSTKREYLSLFICELTFSRIQRMVLIRANHTHILDPYTLTSIRHLMNLYFSARQITSVVGMFSCGFTTFPM